MPNGIISQIAVISDILVEKYVKELAGSSTIIADKVRKIFAWQKNPQDVSFEEFLRREFQIEEGKKIDFKDLRNPNLIATLDHYAKINDILKKLRVIANQQYATEELPNLTADSLEYVLRNLKDKETSPQDVQKCLDQARFTPVLTAHPTNPTSVEYTKVAMELAEAFAEGKWDLVDKKLREVFKVEMSGEKKTQAQEVEELLIYFRGIYDGLPLQYETMQKSVDKFYPGLKLPQNMTEIAIWGPGDGDGNPNSTEASLRSCVQEFEKAIKEKYKQDLKEIGVDVDMQDFEDVEGFLGYLQGYKRSANEAQDFGMVKKLDSLITKVHTFGFHYAKIDMRHEANDIMNATKQLVKHGFKTAYPQYEVPDLENQADLEILLRDENIMAVIRNLDYKKCNFEPKYDELTKRLFGRFQVVAQNPQFFRQVIIAEFKDPVQIAATAFLLRVTGNKFAEKGALPIVPLAESKEDLEKLPADICASFGDEEYFEHIRQTGQVVFMIAKSDAQRRSGPGVHYAQKYTIVESLEAIFTDLIEKGEDPSLYDVIPYNGGGNALQRGGGRITEVNAIYGRYALTAMDNLRKKYAGNEEVLAQIDKIIIKAPFLTTQGQQNGILYGTPEVAAATCEAFTSQAVYAAAKFAGLIPDNEIDAKITKEQVLDIIARFDISHFPAHLQALITNESSTVQDLLGDPELRDFYKAAVESLLHELSEVAVDHYVDHIGTETMKEMTPVVALMTKGPWLFTVNNNLSSRPSVRAVAESQGETISGAQGAKKSLLQQRAIGTEKLCAHSGTNILTWFGWSKAIEALKIEGFDPHTIYTSSKTFRDSMRSAATSIAMTNWDKAWQTLLGQEMPDSAHSHYFEALEASYKEKMAQGRQGEISDEESLCFLKGEAERTARLIYQAITGKEPARNFQLLEKFSILQEEIDLRKENTVFGDALEGLMNALANKSPREPFDRELKKLVQEVYCATETSSTAPIGAINTITRHKEVAAREKDQIISPDFFDQEDIELAFKMKQARQEGVPLFHRANEMKAQMHEVPTNVAFRHSAAALYERSTGKVL